MTGVFSPGHTKVVVGRQPFDVLLGEIEAVTLSLNGQRLELSQYAQSGAAEFVLNTNHLE